MNEYITKAFTALEDLDVSVDDAGLLADKEEKGSQTLRDLIQKEHSYNIVSDIELNGMPYSLYIECTSDGAACDGEYGEFDIDNVDGLIVDLLDADRNALGTLKGLGLDSTLENTKAKASKLLRGDAKEIIGSDESEETEEPEQNIRLFIDDDSEEAGPDEAEKVQDDEADVTPLEESKHYDLCDTKELEQAKDSLSKKSEGVEQIVDLDANTEDELRKTYVGDVVIRCPTCNTKFYKSPEDIDVEDISESDNADKQQMCNTDETCPVCGSKGGFEVIGKVAPLNDAGVDAQKPHEDAPNEAGNSDSEAADDADERAEKPAKDNAPAKVKPAKIDSEKEPEGNDIKFESFDEGAFDELAGRYMCETYSNTRHFSTTAAYIDDDKSTVIVEGLIQFKSGASRKTRFTFEAKELTKRGKIKFSGLNETFSGKKAFTLTCGVEGDTLKCESLSYSYKINESKVAGRVLLPKRG